MFRRKKIISIIKSRFSTKLHFKWTFYGKLALKRCLDAKDWFRDKALVEAKIAFRMYLLKWLTTLTAKDLFQTLQKFKKL